MGKDHLKGMTAFLIDHRLAIQRGRGRADCMALDENSAVLTMEAITAGQAALMRLENGEAFITSECPVHPRDSGAVPCPKLAASHHEF